MKLIHMKKEISNYKIVSAVFVFFTIVLIQTFAWPQGIRKPIIIEEISEKLEDRFERKITLDVREMNVLDVIKFLSIKGDFNMVTTDAIEGRATLYLKNVTIRDAWDIILLSNKLAYYVENDIIHVLTGGEYEAMFGKRFNDKMEVEIVRLNYVKPDYIIATLENIKSELGRIIIDEDTGTVVMIDTEQSLIDMKKMIIDLEKPADVFIYPVQYAQADVLAEQLQARVDAHNVGTISTDARTNRLIVRTIPGRRAEVEQMIKDLDIPTKEVIVDARVLQVVFKPQFDYGIDWQFDFAGGPDREIEKISLKSVLLGDSSPGAPLGSTFGRIGIGDIDVDKFEMFIRGLKQVSDTKILSNPKILVTNNQEATIHVGDTVPYIISTTSGTGDNAITSEDVRFVDVGIKLNVTPRINDDGMVTMHLKRRISKQKISLTGTGTKKTVW